MFGIQKCGTILTVGINLVVCGAIVFYFHKRLLSLETAMLKQQQIFSAFVVEIRNKTQLAQTMVHPRFINQNGPMPSATTELASPEAIAAVSKLANTSQPANTSQTTNISQTNKIEVSDNESSSSEEEDDSDDESVSDKEEEEEKENIKKIKLSDFQETNLASKFEEMMVSSMSNNFMMMQGSGGGGEMLSGGIMIINGQSLMQNEQMMMPCFVEITDLEEEEETTKKVILLNDESDTEFETDDDEEEEKSRKSPVLLQIESLNEGDADEPVKIIKNTDFNELMKKSTTPLPKKTTKKNIVVMDMESGLMTSTSEAGTSANTGTSEAVSNASAAAAETEAANKSENLKVDDLRKLASDKNLAAKEIIKKMKKPELLALLKQ